MNRITASIVTILVALTGLVATTATSTAAAPAAAQSAQSAQSARSAAAPSRTITIRFAQTGGDFKLTGKVSPKGARKPVVLQVRQSGDWKVFRKARTTATGAYAFRNLARAGSFRTKVVASMGFATSYSTIMKVTKG